MHFGRQVLTFKTTTVASTSPVVSISILGQNTGPLPKNSLLETSQLEKNMHEGGSFIVSAFCHIA